MADKDKITTTPKRGTKPRGLYFLGGSSLLLFFALSRDEIRTFIQWKLRQGDYLTPALGLLIILGFGWLASLPEKQTWVSTNHPFSTFGIFFALFFTGFMLLAVILQDMGTEAVLAAIGLSAFFAGFFTLVVHSVVRAWR